ncbi:MAG: flagellar hook-associated protein FlgK [Spirochaetaceae bacterium]|jgi:flagellar hook-associated protein 1 FlgK|nr:flagellar hook-associated protein FlgK [Spirochaetaceae bacterium]
MGSTFSGLEIGKRGVMAHETALGTTGHNLANASTEGYSRQRVELKAMDPIYNPALNRAETPGQIGQGVVVDRIERVRDQLLDRRIIAEASGEGYWTARDQYVRQLDQMYFEPGESSIRSKMDRFWDAWQELAVNPADSAPREAVALRGQTLVDAIHARFNSLKNLSDNVNRDITLTVERVNDLSGQIAGLNTEIQKVRAQGDNPNDLLDRRDLLVDELSSIIDIRVDGRDPDEFMVHTGGNVLIQGGIGRQFVVAASGRDDGYGRVMWAHDPLKTREIPGGGEPYQEVEFTRTKGSLAALIELRDETIASEMQSLDNMTMNFADLVNEIHRSAYGTNGKTGIDFFTEHHLTTNVLGNYDRDSDGVEDSTYLFRMNGTNPLEENAQIGLEGTVTLAAASSPGGLVTVPYYATDTVAEFITRINNSGAEVVARLNREGRLELKATPAENDENPDFVIRHVEDSGYFLTDYAGLLERGAVYDWDEPNAANLVRGGAEFLSTAPATHPAGWLEINPDLLKDRSSIASGFGANGRPANPGNGDAALAIAAIRNNPVMVGADKTFDDHFADAVARVGEMNRQSGVALSTENLIMKQLRDMRDSISGVNMDEELAAMIKYQHGYAAAARFVTTINSMLETLIARFG